MFRFTSTRMGQATVLSFSGELNETSELRAILAFAVPQMILDFGGITRINSRGIRDLMRLLDALRAKGTSITLRECAPALVDALNAFPGLAYPSEIESILIPYNCTACDCVWSQSLKVRHPVLTLPRIEASPCPGCKAEREMDDHPRTYLQCLRPSRARDRSVAA
jgi:anti-anti-sigma regulatory factor